MSNKLLIDTETTGLEYKTNGIISISYEILDANMNSKHIRTMKCNTFLYKKAVSPKALEVNGETIEGIKQYGSPKLICDVMMKDLLDYYDGEKYKIIGYNGSFDLDFLSELFNTYYRGWLWNHIDYRVIDPFKLITILAHEGLVTVKNPKNSLNLESVAKAFSIEHKPHDVESDKEVTRQLYNRLREKLITIDWSNL